jgi:hypothetical protein
MSFRYDTLELDSAPDSDTKRTVQQILSTVQGYSTRSINVEESGKGIVTYDTQLGPVTFVVNQSGRVMSISPFGDKLWLDMNKWPACAEEAIRHWEAQC